MPLSKDSLNCAKPFPEINKNSNTTKARLRLFILPIFLDEKQDLDATVFCNLFLMLKQFQLVFIR
jgi:hypothetical protein